jgi:ABC-2 type transport system permease protein
MLVLYYMGQSIEWASGKPEELTVQALLTSSDLAYIKTDMANAQTLEKEEGDAEGPFDLAVLVRNENTRGHLVWYTTGALLNTGIDQMVSGNNSTLFLNTLNFLCERESNIAIAGKNIATEALLINASAAGWWRTLYMVVMPLGCIAAGVYIFIRRRSLR